MQPAGVFPPRFKGELLHCQRFGAFEPGEETGVFFDDGLVSVWFPQVPGVLAMACLSSSSFPCPELAVAFPLVACVQEVPSIS